MASTKADNNRVVWTYVDDDGTNHAVSAKAVYVLDGTDGAKYGGSAPAASVAAKPNQLKMRAVKCVSAGAPAIWLTVYTTGCDLWATPGTTVTRNLNGVDTVYTSTKGRRGEKNRDGIRETA
jgi:hypothetical protein